MCNHSYWCNPTNYANANYFLTLVRNNLLNNKRITKQHICYMHILWKNTHFKLAQNEGLHKLG